MRKNPQKYRGIPLLRHHPSWMRIFISGKIIDKSTGNSIPNAKVTVLAANVEAYEYRNIKIFSGHHNQILGYNFQCETFVFSIRRFSSFFQYLGGKICRNVFCGRIRGSYAGFTSFRE